MKQNSAAYFAAFYKRNHLRWAVTMFLGLLLIPLNLLTAWVLGAVLDTITSGELSALWRILGIMIGIVAGISLQQLAMNRMQAAFIRKALVQYKSIEESYLVQTFSLIHQLLSFLCTLIMMLCYSPTLTAAVVVFCALPLAVSLLFGKVLPAKEKMVSDQNERFVSHVKDFLSGFSVIKSFKAEKCLRPL